MISSLTTRNKAICFTLIAFFLGLLSYSYILGCEFLGDDYKRIFYNPELLSLKASLTGELGDRPFLMALMWAECQIFEFNPVGYRVVGILLHALVAFQIYQVIKENSSETPFFKSAAFIFGILFCLHPLNGQSVYIVIQNGVVLATLFAILSIRTFLNYLDTKSQKELCLSILYFLLSMLNKPIASFLPLFLFMASYSREGLSKKVRLSPVLYLPVLLLPVLYYSLGKKNIQTYDVGPLKYFLIQMEVWFTYFKVMILPYGLKYNYDFFPPSNVLWNKNWPLLFLHVGIILTVFKYVRHQKFKLFFIGFYLSFLPESSFFPINHLAFEHRTYLPLSLLFIGLGSWVSDSGILKSNKMIRAGYFLMLIYFFLNQIRNFQITPRDNWILHTLENSYNYHEFNFTGSAFLIKNGKLEEVGPVIDVYREKFSEIPIYKILISSYDFKRDPSKTNLLAIIAENLKHDFSLPIVRRWANSLLIKEWGNVPGSFDDHLRLESILSLQMPNFLKDPHEFSVFIKFYEKFANDLLVSEVKLNNVDPKLPEYIRYTLEMISKGHP